MQPCALSIHCNGSVCCFSLYMPWGLCEADADFTVLIWGWGEPMQGATPMALSGCRVGGIPNLDRSQCAFRYRYCIHAPAGISDGTSVIGCGATLPCLRHGSVWYGHSMCHVQIKHDWLVDWWVLRP